MNDAFDEHLKKPEEIHDNQIVLTRAQYETLKADKARRETIGNFYKYVLKCRPDLKPTKLHETLAAKIQEFLLKPGRSDGSSFLLISLPFQTGKTTWGAQSIPAWDMLRNPGHNDIIISYSSAFAMKASMENKRKIEWNLDLFPNAKIGNKWTNEEFEILFDEKNNVKSTCLSATMGTVNGNPCDILVIDDTCHDSIEAGSETFNDNLESNWLSVVRSRVKPGGKVILMQTRWNLNDIFEVIKKFEVPEAIETLNIPCECVDVEHDPLGRALGDGPCPEIGKGRIWVQAFKQAYIKAGNLLTWENNYQGNPTIAGGNLFTEKMFRSCEFGMISNRGLVLTSGTTLVWPCIALSIDAALKHEADNDFNALQVWAKLDEDYYLLSAEKGHYSFPQLMERIYYFNRLFKLNYIYIEEAANGVAAIDMLNEAHFNNVIAVKPEGGKYSRAMAVTWLYYNGHVYFDKNASFYKEFKQDLQDFPNGTHDDDIDAMSQALNRMTMLPAKLSASPKRVGKQRIWTEDMLADYGCASDMEKLELIAIWGEPPDSFSSGPGLDLMGIA